LNYSVTSVATKTSNSVGGGLGGGMGSPFFFFFSLKGIRIQSKLTKGRELFYKKETIF
jgi:hypothetical protein